MTRKHYLLIATLILSFSLFQTAYSVKPESCLLFSITSQNIARIGIVNRENNRLELVIKTKDGEALFTKSVSGYEDYFKLFDLSGMPEGEYVIKLNGGSQSFLKKFSVQNNIASIIKEKKDIKPVFKLIDEEILIISYLNARQNKVNIFFELDDDVVFEERNITGTPVSKKYSLKRLPKGEYTVKVYSGGKIYNYPLAVK